MKISGILTRKYTFKAYYIYLLEIKKMSKITFMEFAKNNAVSPKAWR